MQVGGAHDCLTTVLSRAGVSMPARASEDLAAVLSLILLLLVLSGALHLLHWVQGLTHALPGGSECCTATHLQTCVGWIDDCVTCPSVQLPVPMHLTVRCPAPDPPLAAAGSHLPACLASQHTRYRTDCCHCRCLSSRQGCLSCNFTV